MGRPHIEFIQSADVMLGAWEVPGFSQDTLKSRVLSQDAQTGASTELVELPQGWESPSGYFTCDIEVFILKGNVRVGSHRWGRYTYAFIPAGVCTGFWQMAQDTTALWMTAASTKFVSASKNLDNSRLHRYIPSLDTSSIPWGGTITPGFPPGAMRKSLRTDPDVGINTWMLGVLPQWADMRSRYHPVFEETFVLQGSISGNCGTMTEGCYFWRPSHISHGPYYTDTGLLIFVRAGHPFQTHYAWEPPFHPYYPWATES